MAPAPGINWKDFDIAVITVNKGFSNLLTFQIWGILGYYWQSFGSQNYKELQ